MLSQKLRWESQEEHPTLTSSDLHMRTCARISAHVQIHMHKSHQRKKDKSHSRAGRMAQQIRMLVTKSGNLSLINRIHGRGKPASKRCLLTSTHTLHTTYSYTCTHAHTQTYTHTIFKCNKNLKGRTVCLDILRVN